MCPGALGWLKLFEFWCSLRSFCTILGISNKPKNKFIIRRHPAIPRGTARRSQFLYPGWCENDTVFPPASSCAMRAACTPTPTTGAPGPGKRSTRPAAILSPSADAAADHRHGTAESRRPIAGYLITCCGHPLSKHRVPAFRHAARARQSTAARCGVNGASPLCFIVMQFPFSCNNRYSILSLESYSIPVSNMRHSSS
jgi:hypothetical protein